MKNAGKRLSALFAALMIFVMSAVNCMTAFAADVYTVPVTVKYDQAGARSMLDMINKFRTGSDAWYWNKDGSKNVLSGLSDFQYDYGLEQAAMQRAAELAVIFDHQRPNGTMCFSAADGYLYAENIAANYRTAASVFEGWQETNEKYAGQGHRRNMLGSFPCIGIAHVTVNGMDYWVQDFGYPTGAAKKDVGTGATVVNVDIAKSSVKSVTLTPSAGSITVPLGGSANVPSVSANIVMSSADYWAGNITSTTTPNWSVSGNAVSVSGGKINGNALGSATLTANLYGKSVSVTVKVECTNHQWGGWSTTVPATCTKDGSQSRKCTLCQKSETKTRAAKGHSYGEYKVIRKATATQEGLEERVCSVCGDKQQRTIAKIVTTTTKKTTTPKTATATKNNTTTKTTAKTTAKTASGGTASKETTENGGTTNAEDTTDPENTDITTPQESDAESGTTGDVTTVEVTTPDESEVTTTESDESTESTEISETTESAESTEPGGNNSADSNKGKTVLLIVLGGAGGLTVLGVIFVIIRKIRG